MRRLGDPFVTSLLAVGALAAASIVMLALAWRGVAAEVSVADQVPFVVSGGVAGLALGGFAGGILVIQHRRFAEARRRAEFDVVVQAAAGLLVAVREQTRAPQR